MISPSGSTPEEARAFLDAHPEIEAFDIVLTDANGIGRGKIIRRHELTALYESGRHLPISILGLDITGEDVHETGLIWDSGDGDMRAWPIPGTIAPLHGTNPPRGQVLMSMFHLDGAPMTSDPRLALKRQVEEMAAEGLYPAGAFELEFFLLSNERDADGKVQPAAAVLDGRKSGKTEVYSVDHLHRHGAAVCRHLRRRAKKEGLPAETVISEYAPGQYELTLNYRHDVLRPPTIWYHAEAHRPRAGAPPRRHRLFHGQAHRRNMPAPACICMSRCDDKSGTNIFTEEVEGQWKPEVLHALGG
jgi:glutamine synthetase